jgi:NTE family protein
MGEVDRRSRRGSTVALVLAGGGARGAYEIGMLSVLLPMLERRGERPVLFVGSSVGALNAAFLASAAHLPAAEATALGIERWRAVTKDAVIEPVVARQAAVDALRYIRGILPVPGEGLAGLLDPGPLVENLESWIAWEDLARNLDDGTALAIVATSVREGRTVVFLSGVDSQRVPRSQKIDYVPAAIRVPHVSASAAIPILFPPVRIEDPPDAAGWYLDGGIRFNTPIKPALDLGAHSLVVVTTDRFQHVERDGSDADERNPELADAAMNVMQGTLVDPLIDDIRMLANVNAACAKNGGAMPDADARRALGKPPYRVVPFMVAGPEARSVGDLATDVYESRYGGVKAVRSLDFGLLGNLLGTGGPNHGELLSYLFFDEDFIDELIALGRSDGDAIASEVRDGRDPWRVDAPNGHTRAESAIGAIA